MKKENKIFLLFISLAVTMLIGVIVQNVVSVTKPKTVQLQIDVNKVKQEIKEAGLIPKEALHWKEL